MTVLLIAALLATPTNDRPRIGAHVSTLALHLNDDLEASFGGTSAAAYYSWAYDSASTRFELRSTDCDGGGSDCVPMYIVDGTDDPQFSGQVYADGGFNAGNWYISAATKGFYWAGRTTLTSAADGNLKITNNAGTQGVILNTQTDGALVLSDEAGGAIGLYGTSLLQIGVGGNPRIQFASFITLLSQMNTNSQYIYNSGGAVTINDDATINGVVTVNPYARHIDRPITAATTGATAPTAVTIGTKRCLQFTQATAAETAHIEFEIPDDWVGTSDFTLQFYWHPEAGDAVANAETVQWDATYRSTTYTSTGGEAYDNGTAVTISAIHTQSGAGTDKAGYVTTSTMAYTGGNQPLTKGDRVGVVIDLNEGATSYSGDPILCVVEAALQSNTFPKH